MELEISRVGERFSPDFEAELDGENREEEDLGESSAFLRTGRLHLLVVGDFEIGNSEGFYVRIHVVIVEWCVVCENVFTAVDSCLD